MTDTRSSDERQAQLDMAKEERKQPGVERLLRQFLTVETGQGKSPEYRRGYEFNFEFSQEQRDCVLDLMSAFQLTFEGAFDYVKNYRARMSLAQYLSGER